MANIRGTLARFLFLIRPGVHFFICNSPLAGNVAVEPGPAPQLGRFLWFNSLLGVHFFIFLIRILLGKWRWSWVQRKMLHF